MEKVCSNRFKKNDHFLTLAAISPIQALADVIETYTLDDLRQELIDWQNLALCNDDSAYTEDSARENLIAFLEAFQRTIEALYITHLKKRKPRSASRAELNKPHFLTQMELSQPIPVLRRFTETFTSSYTQIELLDLLEAVIKYKGEKEIQLDSLIFVYQRLSFLADLTYKLT